MLGLVVQKFGPGCGDRILLGMDDSPTARHGQHVEGAGVHHNPTPGPADGEWLYGHNWVALAWLTSPFDCLKCRTIVSGLESECQLTRGFLSRNSWKTTPDVITGWPVSGGILSGFRLIRSRERRGNARLAHGYPS